MNYDLHFRRSDQDMVFFNKFDGKLEKVDGTELAVTFELKHGRGTTEKEAYNLLDGRSVNKNFPTDRIKNITPGLSSILTIKKKMASMR